MRHENVVRTFDVETLERGGQPLHALVMEHVAGRTLRGLLARLGTVPEALLREVARQIAAGLEAIHEKGIVHRDLKPDNVLITDDHRVRIMDLGVAKLLDPSGALTAEGQFAGSLRYAAPEQFGEAEVGPAADLYSLGVLLYEPATGSNPFDRPSAAQVVAAHLQDDPPRAADAGARISPLLAEVLATLLLKEPSERFSSAGALRETLRMGEESSWWAERARVLSPGSARIPRIPVPRRTRLHGREAELRALRDALSGARRSEGSIVLVEGETGIGKTRLILEFLEEVAEEDVHVLYGAEPPSGGGGALLDAILERFGRADLERALASHLASTPCLVPAFAALVRRAAAPAGCEPLRGDAIHAVLVGLLRGLAAERPVLWVVEDLQLADADERRMLLSLVRGLPGQRALLIGTAQSRAAEAELAPLTPDLLT